ncbi:hypothetical protein GCM10009557_39360 [Virgisporangium ochraceum]|uniref:Uncharacterized protein n=1 Tax=Virgisporangium ochraceum TaxID=65505 RepID=A0A8J3ZSJ4_9ACTN|nr:hypothetical protein [Virgisporangium ochraceum]GIJ68926.1 hypothetical protein Voc01_038430 [Virgisporangium ochraceum]
MSSPATEPSATVPSTPEHADLVRHLGLMLDTRSGLARILDAAGSGHLDRATERADRAGPAVPYDDAHAALGADLAATIRLADGAAHILADAGPHNALLDDLATRVDTRRGLAAIRSAAAGRIPVSPDDLLRTERSTTDPADGGATNRRLAGRPRHRTPGPFARRKVRLAAAAGCALVVVVAAAVAAAMVGSAGSQPDDARPATTVGAERGGPGVPDGSENASLRPPTHPPAVEAPGTGNLVSDTPAGGPTGPTPVSVSQQIHGNSVTMQCRGAIAQLVAANTADGWALTRINPGPAELVGVRFESTSQPPYQVTVRGRCEGGSPRLEVS